METILFNVLRGRDKEMRVPRCGAKGSVICAIIITILFLAILASSMNDGIEGPEDSQNILSERERAKVMNDWLKWRLENIIPELMRR